MVDFILISKFLSLKKPSFETIKLVLFRARRTKEVFLRVEKFKKN